MFVVGNIPNSDIEQFHDFWKRPGIFNKAQKLQRKGKTLTKRERERERERDLLAYLRSPPGGPSGRPSPLAWHCWPAHQEPHRLQPLPVGRGVSTRARPSSTSCFPLALFSCLGNSQHTPLGRSLASLLSPSHSPALFPSWPKPPWPLR